MTTGTIIIILSLISTMILTPFWYVFLIIYSLLIGFILWQGVFIKIKIIILTLIYKIEAGT